MQMRMNQNFEYAFFEDILYCRPINKCGNNAVFATLLLAILYFLKVLPIPILQPLTIILYLQ